MSAQSRGRPPIQTLRQARAAYLKRPRTASLSDAELRRLRRAAELEERAERIRDTEARRKQNRERREKKAEQERGARRLMGISSGGTTCQELLGKFWKSGKTALLDGRSPGSAKQRDVHVEDRDGPGNENNTRTPMGPLPANVFQPSPKRSTSREDRFERRSSSQSHVVSSSYHPPHTSRPIQAAPVEAAPPNSMMTINPDEGTIDDWGAFFPSNTQLERELALSSRPKTNKSTLANASEPVPLKNSPLMLPPPRPSSPAQPGIMIRPSHASTLDDLPISTQDLEYTANDIAEIEGNHPTRRAQGGYSECQPKVTGNAVAARRDKDWTLHEDLVLLQEQLDAQLQSTQSTYGW